MSRQSFVVPDEDPRWATHSPHKHLALQWFVPPDLNAFFTYDILLVRPFDSFQFRHPTYLRLNRRPSVANSSTSSFSLSRSPTLSAKCVILHTDSLGVAAIYAAGCNTDCEDEKTVNCWLTHAFRIPSLRRTGRRTRSLCDSTSGSTHTKETRLT